MCMVRFEFYDDFLMHIEFYETRMALIAHFFHFLNMNKT